MRQCSLGGRPLTGGSRELAQNSLRFNGAEAENEKKQRALSSLSARGRRLAVDPRNRFVDASPARRPRGPNGRHGPRALGVVERADAHDDEMRAGFRLAQYL